MNDAVWPTGTQEYLDHVVEEGREKKREGERDRKRERGWEGGKAGARVQVDDSKKRWTTSGKYNICSFPLLLNYMCMRLPFSPWFIAGVFSSQALPDFLITAPPSVWVPAVLGALAVWIQNQKKNGVSPLLQLYQKPRLIRNHSSLNIIYTHVQKQAMKSRMTEKAMTPFMIQYFIIYACIGHHLNLIHEHLLDFSQLEYPQTLTPCARQRSGHCCVYHLS